MTNTGNSKSGALPNDNHRSLTSGDHRMVESETAATLSVLCLLSGLGFGVLAIVPVVAGVRTGSLTGTAFGYGGAWFSWRRQRCSSTVNPATQSRCGTVTTGT
jgi:hypothetical protein